MREQSVRAGEQSIAIKGDVSDSTVIHTQTVALADRSWQELQPALPATDLKEATAAYLNYLVDRHFYLNLKGMGVSDRVPLGLKLLELYAPLKATTFLKSCQTN